MNAQRLFSPYPMILSLLFLLLLGTACSTNQYSTVSVSGEATVKAPVDYLKMQIGVEVTAAQLEQAEQHGYERALAIKKLLQDDLGIPDSLIQTKSSDLGEAYRRPGEEPQYRFRQVFTARLDSIDLFDDVRKQLVDAGAANVTMEEFGSSRQKEFEQRAYRKAYQSAQSKATLLGESSGLHIRKPLSINTSQNMQPVLERAQAMQLNSFADKARESTLIQSHVEISANVQVEFLMSE
jgi:uncharacterized protein YggE